MTTTWTGSPVLSAASINELRTAVDEAGGSPPEWTDGAQLPASATLKAVYATEIRDAIQRLWNDRGLGLIPNWTTGVEPGEPNPTTPVPLQESDITDLRKWFNHYGTWGDLRGVHWWKNTSTDFTGIFWNVESVIAVQDDNGTYNRGAVEAALRRCTEARNYGLVNIVRIDWRPRHAAPRSSADYGEWITDFTEAVNRLKGVATIFVVGNEPNIESGTVMVMKDGEEVEQHRGLTSVEYATAFNRLYSRKAEGTSYLAAGPAQLARNHRGLHDEIDTLWLERVINMIVDLDGWALHTYGAPYLRYAGATDDAHEPCDSPSVDCPVHRDEGKDPYVVDDAGFRRYIDYIRRIRENWASKPVYITETNTSGYQADSQHEDDTPAPPSITYVNGWIQKTYQEVRNFNRENGVDRISWPPVLCLCWFVDSDRDPRWVGFALSNTAEDKLLQARNDFKASLTYTGIDPNNPYSNLAPSPIVEHVAGQRTLSATIT